MLNEICSESSKQNNLPLVKENLDGESSEVTLEIKGDEVFLKDRIPKWVACSGYVALVAILTVTMPIIFLPLKWYLVLCSYILVPSLAFCNSYGTDLTDWSLASTYGKIGLFIIASLVGSDGGVRAGLAARGVMVSTVHSRSHARLQDRLPLSLVMYYVCWPVGGNSHGLRNGINILVVLDCF